MELKWKEIQFSNHLLMKAGKICIKPGEVVIITGESGSGKTTLFNAFVGENDFMNRLESYSLSWLPQKVQLFDSLKVLEYLHMLEDIYGSSTIDYQEFLDFSNDIYPSQLSGGERQRLAIVACLMKEADLYLFDEPTASLDESYCHMYLEFLRKLSQEGKRIIVFTHDETLLKNNFTHYRIDDQKMILVHESNQKEILQTQKHEFNPTIKSYLLKMMERGKLSVRVGKKIITLLFAFFIFFSSLYFYIYNSQNKILTQMTSREITIYQKADYLKKTGDYSFDGAENPFPNKMLRQIKKWKGIKAIRGRYDHVEPVSDISLDLVNEKYNLNKIRKFHLMINHSPIDLSNENIIISSYDYALRSTYDIANDFHQKGVFISQEFYQLLLQHHTLKELKNNLFDIEICIPLYNTIGRMQRALGNESPQFTYDYTVKRVRVKLKCAGVLKQSSLGIYNSNQYVMYIPYDLLTRLIKKQKTVSSRILYITNQYKKVYVNKKVGHVAYTFKETRFQPVAYTIYVHKNEDILRLLKRLKKIGLGVNCQYEGIWESVSALSQYTRLYKVITIVLSFIIIILSFMLYYFQKNKDLLLWLNYGISQQVLKKQYFLSYVIKMVKRMGTVFCLTLFGILLFYMISHQILVLSFISAVSAILLMILTDLILPMVLLQYNLRRGLR